MFINALQKQNTPLIEASLLLLRQGFLSPDTYVIDVDGVEENAHRIMQQAQKYQVTPYVMSKQFGRNPWLTRKIIELGYRGAVAVDFREARRLAENSVPVSHMGHLVQIPEGDIATALSYRPEVITVFSIEKARQISVQSQKAGINQSLLLKVYQPGDPIYPGQEGGFALDELVEAASQISALPSVQVAGVTHFPCLLTEGTPPEPRMTPSFFTLLQAAEILKSAGFDLWQINAPSASSCTSIPLLAQAGATHIEPGHAFTGTIPANQYGDQPEKVAMLYLSEISHHFDNHSLCFGGGYYRRGHLNNALVFAENSSTLTTTKPVDNDSIDYYLGLEGRYPVGSPVVMCFRTQIFVTRSNVALVRGIQTGKPGLVGIYDSLGNLIS